MSDEDFETYRDYIDAWVFDSNEYDDEGMSRERDEVLDFLSRIRSTIESRDAEIERLRKPILECRIDGETFEDVLAERDTLQRENERLQAGMHRFSVVVKERDTLQRRLNELEGALERLEAVAANGYPTRSVSYEMVRHERRQALKNTEKERFRQHGHINDDGLSPHMGKASADHDGLGEHIHGPDGPVYLKNTEKEQDVEDRPTGVDEQGHPFERGFAEDSWS